MSILNSFVEYNRIYWKNKKAGGTPTGATNFNIMDAGIKANNEAIAELNDVKLDNTDERIQRWNKSMPLGDVWLPENGISIDVLDNGSYSTNPNLIPAIGLPDELNDYGTLFINKTPNYNTITYHDVLGGFAVYNTHEGKWCVVAKKTEIPTKLAELTSDEGHRTVTDEQIAKWNSGADIPVATTTKDGLMSAADKIKLDGIENIGVVIDCIAWNNSGNVTVNYSELQKYDFIFTELGHDCTGTNKALWGGITSFIPIKIFKDFVDIDDAEDVSYLIGSTSHEGYITHDGSGVFRFVHMNNQYVGVWGIKIKGETASNVGGKVLAIETDTTASTYHISGNADTTPLILETVAYGSDGSVKDISSAMAYVDGSGAVKLKNMATTISNTYGGISNHSSGVILVRNNEGYKLKVWITGSGYDVTKQ